MAREKTNRIVVYRLDSPDKFEKLDFAAKGYAAEYADETTRLFVQTGKFSTPEWIQYIAPLLSTDTARILNESCSFILLTKHANSVYALAGGYGYTQLEEHVDDDFGLQVAVRLIDGDAISAIGQRAMKGTTRQVFRAVAGYHPVFDRDNYNRVLKALEGKGRFEGRTFRVSGRSSLVLRTAKSVHYLESVLSEVEDILGREPQIHFPKSYEEVKDKDRFRELDEARFEIFRAFWAGDSDREPLYLEFDDPIVQFRCEKFQIAHGHSRVEVEDFDLDQIRSAFAERGIGAVAESEDLRRFRVTGISESGYPVIENQTFGNMLVCEMTRDGQEYIRLGKRWYRILDEVQNFLNAELRKVTIDPALLPAWDRKKHPLEIEYNHFVADTNGWYCLDQDFVRVEGYSKLELCDIYDTKKQQFFHVKQTWGCKSAYLFTQGVIAAQSYRESKVFRDKCWEKWPGLFRNSPEEGTIVFGIAHEKSLASEFPVNMSYFAKLSLYLAVTQLNAYDYQTILAPIEIIN